MIPYAITDGYDTIEESDVKDDIPVTEFPSRHGPLPTPGYSGLMPDEPKPPGVYSRMDHHKCSVEDEERDVHGTRPQLYIDRSKQISSGSSDTKENNTITIMPIHSNLDLEDGINIAEDIATADEEIPSAYLKITNDSSKSNFVETMEKEDCGGKPDTCLNSYLELISISDK